jgi:DNA-binding MarR family transcriptional regulator
MKIRLTLDVNMVITIYVKRKNYSAMDFFVLAMISRGGLHSLYDLQQEAGLQPGGIHPVLKKLEQEGFLERSEQQKRRKRLMTVTKVGEHFLREEWHDCQDDYGDVQSVLRAATVGILMGDATRTCRYLLEIAKQHDKNLPSAPEMPKEINPSAVEWYQYVRWQWESIQRKSASSMFREIAKELDVTR